MTAATESREPPVKHRYLEAITEERAGLSREQLLRRIAALTGTLELETTRRYAMRRAYERCTKDAQP